MDTPLLRAMASRSCSRAGFPSSRLARRASAWFQRYPSHSRRTPAPRHPIPSGLDVSTPSVSKPSVSPNMTATSGSAVTSRALASGPASATRTSRTSSALSRAATASSRRQPARGAPDSSATSHATPNTRPHPTPNNTHPIPPPPPGAPPPPARRCARTSRRGRMPRPPHQLPMPPPQPLLPPPRTGRTATVVPPDRVVRGRPDLNSPEFACSQPSNSTPPQGTPPPTVANSNVRRTPQQHHKLHPNRLPVALVAGTSSLHLHRELIATLDKPANLG